MNAQSVNQNTVCMFTDTFTVFTDTSRQDSDRLLLVMGSDRCQSRLVTAGDFSRISSDFCLQENRCSRHLVDDLTFYCSSFYFVYCSSFYIIYCSSFYIIYFSSFCRLHKATQTCKAVQVQTAATRTY